MIPMQVTLPPLELVGIPSPGLIPPSPFSLYPAEVTNPSASRASSGKPSLLGLTEKVRAAATEGRSIENAYAGYGRC